MLGSLYFLQSFVEDLLDLRQIKDGVFSLSQSEFDPNETFDLICNSFQPQAGLKGIRLFYTNTTANNKPLPKLIGDGKRFQQVIINLVKNAMKFTQKGSIEIKASHYNNDDQN